MPGTVIRKYRELRNLSQKYVATKMGISQNAYSKIENNITQLTVHHLKDLSNILNVPVADLLADDYEIHKPITIPSSVSKTDLLKHIKSLEEIVKSKTATTHQSYIVAVTLIIAAEGSLSPVH